MQLIDKKNNLMMRIICINYSRIIIMYQIKWHNERTYTHIYIYNITTNKHKEKGNTSKIYTYIFKRLA